LHAFAVVWVGGGGDSKKRNQLHPEKKEGEYVYFNLALLRDLVPEKAE